MLPQRRTFWNSPRLWIVFGIALSVGVAITPAPAASKKDPKPPKAAKGAELFTGDAVRVFDLRIPAAALAQLRRSPRTYVKGSFAEGALVVTNVGIHLKGMGSFRTVDEKPSFAVKFNEFVEDQAYGGLTKIMLNNSVQDPSYMAELLATGLFRDAGLPAPRVTHARVRLNGEDLGLYVMIEGINKPFLKQHFKNGKGNLYEGYLTDIDGHLEQDNGETTDQADLRALLAATSLPNLEERFQRLSKILDLERFLSFAAMEMLIGHWDGYLIHTNNYRIYHDPQTDRMVFITHGLDWAFRRPNISIKPPLKSIVGRAVLQTSEGERLYRERLAKLATTIFDPKVITNRMEQTLARLRAAALPPDELENIEKNAGIMRQRIILRTASVAQQLAGHDPEPVRFNAAGTARLTQWRDESDRGRPLMDRVEVGGKPMLHIKARNQRSRGSWRAQAYLARGRYQFEGRVRTAGMLGGAVRLRISGDQTNYGVGGNTEWKRVSHEFRVEDEAADIEFVCDFSAVTGDAWFDLESLQIRQLEPGAISAP